ncbi:IclR family transcriptional regulator [Mycobacteroides abscessus]|uniref:Glycerol operon regulatory protein n=1 Tax=Mycobacteroides abscessus subsp. bolletii TaxID=319705 RepID=A0A9Q7SFU5_9MYCO|nr:IclR family transcriptional regulator [Mycobacteroides abscessus]AMU23015.1 IclR family transcriptional regulator [Mycobacteroides abscessus]EHM14899.1 IclR family regulatory protein [Mycobacteroides abscessus subsp. bolletii BD]MBN7301708.1 IclR family transcriptional regulator [Mycobacteroides abscessus subsp. bolletii]MDO2972289.1 IclR family transcriptional regulator [Mycobacteroides abscessus subsp. bolletii]MDO3071148.1 IclR family transcriptional regulator [Mycobacteroides abscessus 
MDAYGDLVTEAPSVVNRTAALLRAVSADTGTGVSTTELARRTGIPRATAHRLLEALATEGLVERDARSGQWFLGPEIYVLGAASAPRYNITEKAAADVAALARDTSESAFFSLRRGDHTVVLLAEDGDFPIRSHVLYEGARFPLGVVSSGMAVLAYLPDEAIHAYLERADLQSDWGNGFRTDEVWKRIALTRKTGWAVNPGQVVEGSWGMAAAVFDANQNPIGALTLTGIEARFNADRQPVLGQLLLRHAHRLSRTVRR